MRGREIMDHYILIGIILILFLQIIFFLLLMYKLNSSIRAHNCSKRTDEQRTISDNLELDYVDEWEEEIKRTVELQCMQVRNSVQKQCTQLHKKEIELAPQELSIPSTLISAVYNKEEEIMIEQFWLAYRNYLNKHWLTTNGNIRSVFRGTEEVNEIHYASKQLTKKLNNYIQKIILFS